MEPPPTPSSLSRSQPVPQHFACYSTIKLADGVTPFNYTALLINAMFAISLLIFVNTEQAFLLTEIYKVPVKDIGNVSGQLSIVDEVMNLVAMVFAGVLSDRIGRKIIVAVGYALCAIALALFPHGRPFLEYPGDLIALRLVFALGSAALASTLTALLADYVSQSHLGKAAGINGLASATGAVFTVFVLLRLPAFVCLAPTYYITATIAGVVSVIMFCGLNPGLPSNDPEQEMGLEEATAELHQQHPITDGHQRPVVAKAENLWTGGLSGLKTAIGLARHDMVVVVSYLSGFSSRGAAVTISVFISLWVNKFYQGNSLCFGDSTGSSTNATSFEDYSKCSEDLTDPDKVSCPAAFGQSSTINGVVQVVALASSPLFGILCDRITDPVRVFLLATGSATIAFSLVAVVEDPTAPAMLGLSVLLGASQIFLVVSSQWLITMKMPADIRGAVAGFYSLCGGIGVIFFVNLGGYLFDEWKGYGPFLLVGLTNALFFVGILLLGADRWYKKNNSKPSKDLDNNHGIELQHQQQSGRGVESHKEQINGNANREETKQSTSSRKLELQQV